MKETTISFSFTYMVAKVRLSYRKLTPLMKLQEFGHGRSYVIAYMRCDVSGKGNIENVFFTFVELTMSLSKDAESIHNSLKQCLRIAGLDIEFLEKYFISIATDGAAVLTKCVLTKPMELLQGLSMAFQTSSPYIAWPIAFNWLSRIL